MQVEIINKENKKVGKADLPDEIFGTDVKKGLLHEIVRNHLANKRQGTAATKTKGLVSGGGRKPYKQKGTGRGKGGKYQVAIVEGRRYGLRPAAEDYSYKLPKKVKWGALNSALSAKLADDEVTIIDSIAITEPKTRLVREFLDGIGITSGVLIIVPEKNEALELAARNIPKVDVARVKELNVYSILSHNRLLIVKDAVEKMKETYLV